MYERSMKCTKFGIEDVIVEDYCTSDQVVRKLQPLSAAESERLQL
jgi:hypothetical protein